MRKMKATSKFVVFLIDKNKMFSYNNKIASGEFIMEENNIDNNEEVRILIKKISKCQNQSKKYNVLGIISAVFACITGALCGSLIGNAISGFYLYNKPGLNYTIGGLFGIISFLLFFPIKSYCDIKKIMSDVEERVLINELESKNK